MSAAMPSPSRMTPASLEPLAPLPVTADLCLARRDALAERLREACAQMGEVATLYLGERLGLYRALAAHGPATVAEVAAVAHVHERYVREWLEQQAVAGVVDVVDPASDAAGRRYRLPPGHAEVLIDGDSLSHVAPLAREMVAAVQQLPALLEAFRTGDGVPWSAYGDDVRDGQAAQNRPEFLRRLGSEWFPAIPELHARLLSCPPARVADVACGAGWSTIAIARAYPQAMVEGFDSDRLAIDAARQNADQMGLVGRLPFHLADISQLSLSDSYDLVTMFEALHDLAQPVRALAAIRRMLAPRGTVIVMDERVPEEFQAPGPLADRLLYAFSVLLCLPSAMTEQPSAATGAMMRPSTLRRYALDAGFHDVEILPIDHPTWRFYRLIP